MRKAVLFVAVAGLLASLQPAQAANLVETLTVEYPTPIHPVPGDQTEGSNGVMSPACATGGVTNDSRTCEKSINTLVARCLYLNDPAAAQDASTKTGTIAALVEITASAVRGSLATDLDNNTFDLFVTNKTQENVGGTIADLPDVDITFYARLGACVSDIEQNTPAGPVYVPVEGDPPITFSSNPVYQGAYTTYGDEMNRAFPSGAYPDPNNPTETLYASKYFALITIVGGTDAEITFRCRQRTFDGDTRECGDKWFKFL